MSFTLTDIYHPGTQSTSVLADSRPYAHTSTIKIYYIIYSLFSFPTQKHHSRQRYFSCSKAPAYYRASTKEIDIKAFGLAYPWFTIFTFTQIKCRRPTCSEQFNFTRLNWKCSPRHDLLLERAFTSPAWFRGHFTRAVSMSMTQLRFSSHAT